MAVSVENCEIGQDEAFEGETFDVEFDLINDGELTEEVTIGVNVAGEWTEFSHFVSAGEEHLVVPVQSDFDTLGDVLSVGVYVNPQIANPPQGGGWGEDDSCSTFIDIIEAPDVWIRECGTDPFAPAVGQEADLYAVVVNGLPFIPWEADIDFIIDGNVTETRHVNLTRSTSQSEWLIRESLPVTFDDTGVYKIEIELYNIGSAEGDATNPPQTCSREVAVLGETDGDPPGDPPDDGLDIRRMALIAGGVFIATKALGG